MARQGILDIALAWFIAGIVTHVVASVAQTQAVLAGIESLGVPVPLEDRLRMTAGDIAGLYVYGLIILFGLALAFAVMGWMGRLSGFSAWVVYPVGGALAILAILVSMKFAMAVTPIAGARGSWGLAMQCLAGAIGGLTFAWLRSRRVSTDPASRA